MLHEVKKARSAVEPGTDAEETGRFDMLRLTLSTEEYLMLGDDIKIVFLGGTGKHLRIMIDAPREVDIVRSRLIERKFTDPEIRATLPKYYAEPEHPEKYKKKKKIVKQGQTG